MHEERITPPVVVDERGPAPLLKPVDTVQRSTGTLPQLGAPERAVPHSSGTWLVARCLGALAVLAVGAVHLQQYGGPYQAIPTIGTLFALNFAAASVIGLALLAPIEHLAGRWAGPVVLLVSLAGIALAASSFVLLLLSERTPLFGFQEPGYDPAAITAARETEIAAAVLLGTSLMARFATKARKRRW